MPRSKPTRKATASKEHVVGDPTEHAFFFRLSKRDSVFVDPGKEIEPGSAVLIVTKDGARNKGVVARYWPGPPRQFAQIVNPMGHTRVDAPKSLPRSAQMLKVLGYHRSY